VSIFVGFVKLRHSLKGGHSGVVELEVASEKFCFFYNILLIFLGQGFPLCMADDKVTACCGEVS